MDLLVLGWLVPRDDAVALVVVLIAIPGLLPAPKIEPLLVCASVDLFEEIDDRLVGCRDDSDSLLPPHQVDSHPCAGPRLARTGRSLDEDRGVVEAGDLLAKHVDVDLPAGERWRSLYEARDAAQ